MVTGMVHDIFSLLISVSRTITLHSCFWRALYAVLLGGVWMKYSISSSIFSLISFKSKIVVNHTEQKPKEVCHTKTSTPHIYHLHCPFWILFLVKKTPLTGHVTKCFFSLSKSSVKVNKFCKAAKFESFSLHFCKVMSVLRIWYAN